MLRLETVDAYLGPAAARFFGSGYRRVRYRLGAVTFDSSTARIAARAGVGYPVDWSRKDAPTAPHLSTIDALVLAVRLAEIHLGHTFQLDRDQRRRMWLKRIDIRAGGAPTEDGLDAIDVSGTLKHTAAGLVCERQSVFDARIASMSVRCVIEHDVGAVPALPAADGVFPLAADAEAADEIRPYGTGFMTRHPQLTDVSVDPDLTQAQATVSVTDAGGTTAVTQGLEAAYWPSVTIVDVFVVALQLGQILLYELDGVPRAGSETLWMRQTAVECDWPRRSDPVFPVATSLAGARVLERGQERWRAADIVGEGGGIRIRCAVAHRIPDPAHP